MRLKQAIGIQDPAPLAAVEGLATLHHATLAQQTAGLPLPATHQYPACCWFPQGWTNTCCWQAAPPPSFISLSAVSKHWFEKGLEYELTCALFEGFPRPFQSRSADASSG
ncbi:hypothetical protein AAFF_G00032320 [Aldrovandia affinis]|uniref:Uncharacterized protein n=1 Tax=Aldrovandia affinis TaxID=143900 RepID=A0AAD7S403_9TELE|nr:hypothetical protein AAFF_G00032320 [Aldrovandia affinis]